MEGNISRYCMELFVPFVSVHNSYHVSNRIVTEVRPVIIIHMFFGKGQKKYVVQSLYLDNLIFKNIYFACYKIDKIIYKALKNCKLKQLEHIKLNIFSIY
jgi:hypothetical protein